MKLIAPNKLMSCADKELCIFMSACMTEIQFLSKYVSQEHNMCIHKHTNACVWMNVSAYRHIERPSLCFVLRELIV